MKPRKPHGNASRHQVWLDLRDAVPVLLAAAPYGLIVGIAAADAGLGIKGAMSLSILLFAGVSQLAVIDQLTQETSVMAAVVTALIINSRFVVYSASLSTQLRAQSLPRRAVGAYLLSEQAYAAAIARFVSGRPTVDPWSFYLTVAAAVWAVWQAATLLGAAVGTAVPDQVPLDFGVALVFLALLVPTIRRQHHLVAAAVAGATAIIVRPLAGTLTLLLASGIGVVAGWAVLSRTRKTHR